MRRERQRERGEKKGGVHLHQKIQKTSYIIHVDKSWRTKQILHTLLPHRGGKKRTSEAGRKKKKRVCTFGVHRARESVREREREASTIKHCVRLSMTTTKRRGEGTRDNTSKERRGENAEWLCKLLSITATTTASTTKK